jgi:hypothetical protein
MFLQRHNITSPDFLLLALKILHRLMDRRDVRITYLTTNLTKTGVSWTERVNCEPDGLLVWKWRVAECGSSSFLVRGNKDQRKKLIPINAFDK